MKFIILILSIFVNNFKCKFSLNVVKWKFWSVEVLTAIGHATVSSLGHYVQVSNEILLNFFCGWDIEKDNCKKCFLQEEENIFFK